MAILTEGWRAASAACSLVQTDGLLAVEAIAIAIAAIRVPPPRDEDPRHQ